MVSVAQSDVWFLQPWRAYPIQWFAAWSVLWCLWEGSDWNAARNNNAHRNIISNVVPRSIAVLPLPHKILPFELIQWLNQRVCSKASCWANAPQGRPTMRMLPGRRMKIRMLSPILLRTASLSAPSLIRYCP